MTIQPRAWGSLASLSLCILLPSLDTNIANTGLPTLARAFGASFGEVQWVVLAYLLAITALIVSVGRLGDMIGRRRLLLAGTALFTLASFLCGVAPTLVWLIAARAVQGLSAAVMMALSVAFVGDTVEQARLGRAMGLLGTVSAIGTTLGPSLGGALIAGLGWRAIFLINVPLGLLSFYLAGRYLPADQCAKEGSGFDAVATILLAGTLAAYASGITLGRGHFGILNIALLLAAVCGAGFFVAAQSRAKFPLVQLTIVRDPLMRASLAASASVSAVMMTTLVVGPFYLARGLGLSSEVVGLVLSVGPLVAALAGLPAGRLVDSLGAERMTMAGLAAMAVGSSILALLPARLGVAGYLLPIALMTASYALFQAANNTVIMTGISSDQRGVMAGMISLFRHLGLITGASLMGAVFEAASATADITSASPQAVAAAMRFTFAVAAGLVFFALALTGSSLRDTVPRHPGPPARDFL